MTHKAARVLAVIGNVHDSTAAPAGEPFATDLAEAVVREYPGLWARTLGIGDPTASPPIPPQVVDPEGSDPLVIGTVTDGVFSPSDSTTVAEMRSATFLNFHKDIYSQIRRGDATRNPPAIVAGDAGQTPAESLAALLAARKAEDEANLGTPETDN